MASAVVYAPLARPRRALSTSRSAAFAGSPAASARSAASSHTGPGSPGWARSTAGHAREARSRRSGGSRSLEHGLAGEGVTEEELVAVDLDDLRVHGGSQRVDDRAAVHLGHPRKEVPVESPAEHRSRPDDVASGRV